MASHKLQEIVDDYGWASSDDDRRRALLRWMQETTDVIRSLEYRMAELSTRAGIDAVTATERDS